MLVNDGVEMRPQLVGGGPQPLVERRKKSQRIGGAHISKKLAKFHNGAGQNTTVWVHAG